MSRTRPGLPNDVLARATYANLEAAGPPAWGEEARAFAPGDPRVARAAARRRPAGAVHGRADHARRRGGRDARAAAGVAAQLHLRRLRRVHVAHADGAPLHRPVRARAGSGRQRATRRGCRTRSAAIRRASTRPSGRLREPSGDAGRPADARPTCWRRRRPSSPTAREAASAATPGSRRCSAPTSSRRSSCAGPSTSRRRAAADWWIP